MDRLRILVAEDDALIAMLLDDVLAQMGHEVCATEFSQAGTVAAAARCRPDLIIVDVRLGEGSGVLAVDEILKGGFIPHVFTSGDLAALRELEGRAVVIEKPFLEPQLARALTMAMASGLGRPTLSPEEPA
jgi:two-component system, response regulator PdtaR